MKSIRILVSLSLVLTAATLFAQTESSQTLMKINVRFSFNVENHSMPAGEYLIYTVTPQRSVRIVSVDGSHALTVNTLPNYASQPSAKSSLTFHRYANDYFLAQIQVASQSVVRGTMTSSKEVNLARNGSDYQRTTILAFSSGK
jgi:hypothetical protein